MSYEDVLGSHATPGTDPTRTSDENGTQAATSLTQSQLLDSILLSETISSSLDYQSQDIDILKDTNNDISNPFNSIKRALKFERGSPVLLPWQSCINNIQYIKKWIDNTQNDIDNNIIPSHYILLKQLELDRSQYLLTELYRTRLKKIEKLPSYYAENPMYNVPHPDDPTGALGLRGPTIPILSPAELSFAKKLVIIINDSFTESLGPTAPKGRFVLTSETPRMDLPTFIQITSSDMPSKDLGNIVVSFNNGDVVLGNYDLFKTDVEATADADII